MYKYKKFQPNYVKGPAGLTSDLVWSLFRRESDIAFLDSRPGYGDDSRWSILALEPWLSLQAWPDRLEINGKPSEGDIWQLIQQILTENQLAAISDLPLQGGCIG
ncbi:MAG TPA: hypothetical protein DCM45_06910, partial [Clostridiales bacterium]|nr:hypothetical protein [Clostridiales bacterium]